MCVRTTAMYVARVRSRVRWKSDISVMRLALLGEIPNTNRKSGEDKTDKTPQFYAQLQHFDDLLIGLSQCQIGRSNTEQRKKNERTNQRVNRATAN